MASHSGGRYATKDIPTFIIDTPSNNSYAAPAATAAAVKHKQGIVLDCIEGLNLTNYTCAIGDLVDKKNVLSASTISNNSICVYVATKKLVNQITGNQDHILMNIK